MSELTGCVDACDVYGAAADIATTCVNACFQEAGFRSPSKSIFSIWYIAVPLSVVFICFTSVFAALPLAYFSLDPVGLKVLEAGGTDDEKKQAEATAPIREKGNRLLCTLLLGNTLTNAALSICLAELTTGVYGLLISTVVILIFGEIAPQAFCINHSLKISYYCTWFTKICLVLAYPICWPLSKVLDLLLGKVDLGQMYTVAELKRLIELHVTDVHAQKESGLTKDDQKLFTAVLDYKEKRVKDIMTSLDKCFLLEKSMRLDFQNMLMIFRSGFTRIPVYEGVRENIIGILYAKDLILVDPDDQVEAGRLAAVRSDRTLSYVSSEVKLDEVFKQFMVSQNHMMLVTEVSQQPMSDVAAPAGAIVPAQDMKQVRIVGLITLEDVMEELVQEEIVDESDVFVDVDRQVSRKNVAERVDVATFLAVFEHKLGSTVGGLSAAESSAVAAFLSNEVPAFSQLAQSEVALQTLISKAQVIEQDLVDGEEDPASPLPRSRSLTTQLVPQSAGFDGSAIVLYRRGQPTDMFTLVLQGHTYIRIGSEDFQLENGPWSFLGIKALTQQQYVPDFDAVAAPPCRLLRISRKSYLTALEASRLDPNIHKKGTRMMKQIQGPTSSTYA